MPKGKVREVLALAVVLSFATVACATAPEASKGSNPTNSFDSWWVPVEESPAREDDEGLVTVVVFNDLLCEECGEAAQQVEKLRARRDSVRVVHKFYPLGERPHRLAARAAAFAAEREKFWPMYDAIIDHRDAIRDDPRAKLEQLAEKIGLDTEAFADRIDRPGPREEPDALSKRIRRDVELGRNLGLEGPPAAFVNGRMLAGGEELSELDQAFEAARARADRLLKGGVAPSMLYQTASGLAHRRQNLNEDQRYDGSLAVRAGGEEGGGLEVARGPESDLIDSVKVPIGDSPIRGPSDAPVTIVVYANFQCHFSKKGHQRLKRVRKNYPDEVRIVFKHYALPYHERAKPASRATLAAREQGVEYYWKMHDRLFERQDEWKSGDVEKVAARWAEEMGMDREQFERDLRRNKSEYNEIVETHMVRARKLGAKGTPYFFINGEAFSGAKPYGAFESSIDDRLDQVTDLVRRGVDRRAIYAKAVAENLDSPDEKPDNKEPETNKPKDPEENEPDIESVPVDDDDAVRGASAEEALVTFVTFAGFPCAFSKKAQRPLQKLYDKYGDQVRFVFKHHPLDFQGEAKPAARASIAAQKQGKFWEMHDLLFDNQRRLREEEVYIQLAEELGLDLGTFEQDMESEEVAERMRRDKELAEKLGGGTPNFWINGVNVVGAQPYSKLEEVVEQQLERGKIVEKQRDVSGEELYEAVVEFNQLRNDDSDARKVGSESESGSADRVDTSLLMIGNAPTRGPTDAPIVLYEFSDFECSFCRGAHETVEKLMEEYDGKILHVHKDFPVSRHRSAMPAAKAAMAAQKQEKFWAMYDKMFKEQEKIRQDGQFQKWAEEIGLNVEKFKSDMEEVSDRDVKEDMEMGKKVGVPGAPVFFINDRRVVGAQPYSKFKTIVEEELESE